MATIKLLSILTIAGLTSLASAQTWSIDVRVPAGPQGDGYVKGLLALPDGGLVVSGRRGSPPKGFVARWDALGQPLFDVECADCNPGRAFDIGNGTLLVPWSGFSSIGALDLNGNTLWRLPSSEGFYSYSDLCSIVAGAPGEAMVACLRSGCVGSCLGGKTYNGLTARFSTSGTWLGTTRFDHFGAQGLPTGSGLTIAWGLAGNGDGRAVACGSYPTSIFTTAGWVTGLSAQGIDTWTLEAPSALVPGGASKCIAVSLVAPDLYVVLGQDSAGAFASWITVNGQIQKELRFAGGPNLSLTDVAAAGDGGMLISGVDAFGSKGNLVLLRLSPDGSILWQRRLAALDSNFTLSNMGAVARSANGGWFVGTRRQVVDGQQIAFLPRVYRLDAQGRIPGGCAEELADPTYSVQPTSVLISGGLGIMNYPPNANIGLSSLAAGQGQLQATCAHPAPQVQPQGGQLGGPLSFGVAFPAHPGEVGLVLLSGLQASSPIGLPGGISCLLLPDALTLFGLQQPFLAPFALNNNGQGASGVLLLPNNPGLLGLSIFSVAASFSPLSAVFTASTQPALTVLH
jgi:hypothetical protein